MTKENKTNVMRILEQGGVLYQSHSYIGTGAVNGMEVATALHQDINRVFKTLVTVSKSRRYYVFMIPVAAELDLKKAAKAVGEKAVDMLPMKELLPLTGYVHGGCSPIGMKKLFPTVIHETAATFDSIIFSGGKIGYQVELSLDALKRIIPVETADLIESVTVLSK